MAIRSISCFAGCGGLDVAVELAIAGVEHERADAIRAIGNGVVPLQAAAILRELIGRVGARIAT